MKFRFNIKYFLIRSSKKALIILGLLSCIELVIYIYLLPFSDKVYSNRKYLILYIFVPIACIYCILGSLTYQIFKKIKENRKQSQELKDYISKGQLSENRKQKRIQVFLRCFIILTFILLNAFPLLLLFLYEFLFPHAKWLYNLVVIFRQLGWIADPLIYIFSLKPVRRKIQHSFKTLEKVLQLKNDTLHSQNNFIKNIL